MSGLSLNRNSVRRSHAGGRAGAQVYDKSQDAQRMGTPRKYAASASRTVSHVCSTNRTSSCAAAMQRKFAVKSEVGFFLGLMESLPNEAHRQGFLSRAFEPSLLGCFETCSSLDLLQLTLR